MKENRSIIEEELEKVSGGANISSAEGKESININLSSVEKLAKAILEFAKSNGWDLAALINYFNENEWPKIKTFFSDAEIYYNKFIEFFNENWN